MQLNNVSYQKIYLVFGCRTQKDLLYYNEMKEMERYHLKIAPGYKASMDIYNNKLLLCTELAHKLINFDTVQQVITKHYYNAPDNYKQVSMNHLVGQTVMTKYK